MIDQEKYTQLKNLIKENNPKILDHKIGCEVRFKQKGIEHSARILIKNYAGNFLVEVMSGVTTTIKPESITKTIGRQINLSDVLRLIDNINSEKTTGAKKIVDHYNTEDWFGDFWCDICLGWDTANDDLDYQRAETKQHLINLLIAR